MNSHLTSLINLTAHDTFENLSHQRTQPTPPSPFSTIRATNISNPRSAQPIDYFTAYQQLHEQLEATGLLYQRKKQTVQPTYTIFELTASDKQPLKEPVIEGHLTKCRCVNCVRERKRRQCRGGSQQSHGEPDLNDKFYHCDLVEDERQRHRARLGEVCGRQQREQRQAQQVALALALKEERRRQDELLYVELLKRLRALCKLALPVMCVRPTPRVTSTSQGEQGGWQVMSRRGKKARRRI